MGIALDAQAIFRRRRHQPSRPPLAKIKPGIWDSRNLAGTRRFEPTGPCLPIEFCRASRNEYLTLVIDEIVGVPCITYSATSAQRPRNTPQVPPPAVALQLLGACLLLSLQPLKLLWGESVRHPHIPRMQ